LQSSCTRSGRWSLPPRGPATIVTRRMAIEIVGGEEELSSLEAFLDHARRGPATLVLEGEAGIGKSTLWEAAVEHARAQGLAVLSSRPAEAERALGHVGLADLHLPGPRRGAAHRPARRVDGARTRGARAHGRGRSNGAIGHTLFLSPKTVEANVRQIFQKLGLQQSPDDHRRVLAVLRYLRPATPTI
jgi:hypothetical protein